MHPELIGGRYRVVRAIGRGGMGTVWLCRDETLAREVAVKQVGLLPGRSDTDTARAMREARSTAALSHRNVVTVFDVIEEDHGIWLVMEHVPSRSLAEVLREEGALPPGTVAAIGARVADGLAAAHRAGITHRDVKPGNILIGEGIAKIGDFGISRIEGDPALTGTGLVTGTPTYFSPELATGGNPSPASDVWALGATLYHAVEGRPPYQPRNNPVAVLHAIAQTAPPRPRRAGPLEPVLTRMLDRNPATRWSMEDVAFALHRLSDDHREDTTVLTGTLPATTAVVAPAAVPSTASMPPAKAARTAAGPTGAPAAPPASSPGDPAERQRRRRPVGLVLLGVLALVGALLAVLLLDPGGDPGDGGGQDAGNAASQDTTPSEPEQEQPPTEEPTGEPTEEASPPEDTSPPEPAQTATPVDAAAFVDSYFDTVPDDLDAGWAMLSSRFQAAEAGPRDDYEEFWGTIESVDAQDLRTVPGGAAVEATIVYVRTDGSTSTERKRIALVSEGGELRIDDEDPF